MTTAFGEATIFSTRHKNRRFNVRSSSPKADQALDQLQAHMGLVVQTAVRILGSMHDAEEVAQDLAEKLLKKPPNVVENWPAYLKMMATNRALDGIRQRKDFQTNVALVSDNNPERNATQAQQADRLRRAITRLSNRDGELFAMHYLADLGLEEIAEITGSNANAVGVALHRVRSRLADLVNATTGELANG